MATTCRDDPVVCIDTAFLFIEEFLKDWTTLAMLAILLGLLFKLRADQQKAREFAYAQQMTAYDEKRRHAPMQSQTWDLSQRKPD